MLDLPRRTAGRDLKRFVAIVPLLAVFFLPLHFHALNVNAKLASECVCAEHTRLTTGPAPTSPYVSPVFDFQPVVFAAEPFSPRISVSVRSIRAPPPAAVL